MKLTEEYRITADFPKRTFHDRSNNSTLYELGLYKKELLTVENM
jgi:hypothetical protein